MMKANIVYTKNKTNLSDIYSLLKLCSGDMIPNLDKRVDLVEYVAKIHENAECFEAWHKGTLVGVIACYYNDYEVMRGFITHLSVVKSYRGQGIAKKITNNCLNYGIAIGFKKVNLEVNMENSKGIRFWEMAGFERISVNGDIVYMEKIV